MFDISPIQIVIVLAIALLIFGPKRLPDLGRNLGRGIRDFKDGLTNDTPAHIHHAQQTAPAPGEAEALAGPAFAPEVEVEEILAGQRPDEGAARMSRAAQLHPTA